MSANLDVIETKLFELLQRGQEHVGEVTTLVNQVATLGRSKAAIAAGIDILDELGDEVHVHSTVINRLHSGIYRAIERLRELEG